MPTYWQACPKPKGNDALLPCVIPVTIGGTDFTDILCSPFLLLDWQNLLSTIDTIRTVSSAKSKLPLFDSFSSYSTHHNLKNDKYIAMSLIIYTSTANTPFNSSRNSLSLSPSKRRASSKLVVHTSEHVWLSN